MSNKLKVKTVKHDIVIIGGGLSGMCAAIAAARNGAEVALVQGRHVFGGNASSEIRMHICGASENMAKPELEEAGILYEMMLKNKSINDYYNFSKWDMVLYESVKYQKGLTAYLNTIIEDVETENSSIKKVIGYQNTTETKFIIEGKIFIDCTGNATIGYLAGAEYRIGSEAKSEFSEPHAPESPDKYHMGNTLLFKAVDRGTSINFKRPSFARHFSEEELKYRTHSTVHSAKTKGNVDDSYLRLTSFSASSVDYGYWWIELCGDGEDIIDEYEKIRDDLVECIYGIWDHLKNVGDHGAQNYDLEWVGMLPGVRESRRLIGDHILNENEILSNAQFDDAVAYGGWAMDIHAPHGLYDFNELPSTIVGFEGAYTIPYRCYYSKNISNMMMAGRDISVSRMALGSVRVMGTCAIGGQAVGTAAAMCMKYNCLPREIGGHISELQQNLLKDDCYIPGMTNTDENDFARTAKISASSFKKGYEPVNVICGVSRAEKGKTNEWISDGISQNGETISLELAEKKKVSQVRLTFDSNFNYAIKITMSSKRQAQQRNGVPEELVKDYVVSLWSNGKKVAEKEIIDNCLRLNVVDFEPTLCDKIEITVKATNGCKDVRVFEIRAY